MAVTLAGCATAPGQQGGIAGAINDTFNNEDPCANNNRNLGLVLGTAAGAILGATIAKNKAVGALAGAAIGGVVGGVAGSALDRRRCELSKIAKQYNLDLNVATIASDGQVLDDAALHGSGNADEIKKTAIGSVVSVSANGVGGHFESNSDVPTPRAREYFAAIAESYGDKAAAAQIANPDERAAYVRQLQKRKLLLVGHTDDTGSTTFNAELSERRAKAVAAFLEKQGLPRDAIFYQGAGEVYPIADNRTEEGRAKNRRVEIVELEDEGTFQKYLAARKPNYEFYRPEVPSATTQIPASAPAAKAGQEPAKTTRTGSGAANASVSKPAPQANAATPSAPAASLPVSGKPIDFGGVPLTQADAVTQVGAVKTNKPWFSLVSPAYANEPAVLADCSQDRPRASGAVRALKDGTVYKTSEHVRGLYGKSWTDAVNGHRIIINKVAVLASEATLAQTPEFKVYANYDPGKNRNPAPDVSVAPPVNTYLGSNGILYRIFINGNAGLQCADILFPSEGGTRAKAGKLVYTHDSRLYVADFQPAMIN